MRLFSIINMRNKEMKILKSIKSLFVFIFFLASMSVFSQSKVETRQNGSNIELYFYKPVNISSTYNKIIGSPYLDEKFLPASINKSKMTYFVRFNVVENRIEFKDKNGLIKVLSKSSDYEIRLLDGSNREYETHSYKDKKRGVSNTFYEKIYGHEIGRAHV